MRISDWSSDVCSFDLELNMSEDIEAAMAADIHRGDQSAAAATDKVRDYFSGYKSITNWEEQSIERTCEVRAAVAAEITGAVEEVDRKSVVSGKRVSVRVDLGCGRIMTQKKITL